MPLSVLASQLRSPLLMLLAVTALASAVMAAVDQIEIMTGFLSLCSLPHRLRGNYHF